MPRQKPDDHIDMLRRQQADITAKLKDAEAKARLKRREDDQRREQIVGRLVLEKLESDPKIEWRKAMIELLDGALKRPADRALFPILSAQSQKAETQTEP